MSTIIICHACGRTPRIVACYGGFGVVCGCPPVETVTCNGTQVPVSRFEPRRRSITASTEKRSLSKNTFSK